MSILICVKIVSVLKPEPRGDVQCVYIRTLSIVLLFLSGLRSSAGLWIPAGRFFSRNAEGDDGYDSHLGPAKAWLSSHLHRHLRQPGQHVFTLPPPHQALAVL